MKFLYPYSFASPVCLVATAALLLAGTLSATAAPRVRIDTVMGDIDMELLHEEAPLTVTNFLNYVVTDRYDEMFFHRMIPDFVVQGGGFSFPEGSAGYQVIPIDDTVPNEPGVLNTRGTVAMAKPGNDPNGASSQFFFNLADNPHLNTSNGGFTVFARVIGNGMSVVDAMAELPTVDGDGPFEMLFDDLPLRHTMGSSITRDHLVIVNDVQILPTGIPGDYNANGLVEQQDLDLVLANWGRSAEQIPAGWFQGLPSGTVDQNELDAVLVNWGNSAGGSSLASANVPEPATWLLAAMAIVLLPAARWVARGRLRFVR